MQMNILKMDNISIKHGFIIDKSIIFEHNNRSEIKQNIGKNIVMLKQGHTSNIIEVTEENIDYLKKFYNNPNEYIIGDGLITQLKDTILTCFTADCCCIFLYAKDINTIAIVHSGWAGTFKNINENIIAKFKEMGANITNLSIAIAPSIAQKSYPVEDDFYDQFISQNIESKQFFLQIDNKFYYDNAGYIIYKYKSAGITDIYYNKRDTYLDDELFSHRYYTHFGKKYGRMLGFISIDI